MKMESKKPVIFLAIASACMLFYLFSVVTPKYIPNVRNFTRVKSIIDAQLAKNNDVVPSPSKGDLKVEIAGIQKYHHADITEVNKELFSTQQVMCAVLSTYTRVDRMEAILDTWGKRCHKIIFFVGAMATKKLPNNLAQNPRASVIELEMQDANVKTWQKVRLLIKYIDKKQLMKGFKWLFRVDDDAYVIFENLLLFLNGRNPALPEYYGCEYKVHGGYVGTGPGLAISAQNFKPLAELINRDQCNLKDTHDDDVEIAHCLRKKNILVGDSRDVKGRLRFFSIPAMGVVSMPDRPSWIHQWLKYPMKPGTECCSDDFIGFHYVDAKHIRLFEMLIYNVHPFGTRLLWQHFQP